MPLNKEIEWHSEKDFEEVETFFFFFEFFFSFWHRQPVAVPLSYNKSVIFISHQCV